MANNAFRLGKVICWGTKMTGKWGAFAEAAAPQSISYCVVTAEMEVGYQLLTRWQHTQAVATFWTKDVMRM